MGGVREVKSVGLGEEGKQAGGWGKQRDVGGERSEGGGRRKWSGGGWDRMVEGGGDGKARHSSPWEEFREKGGKG